MIEILREWVEQTVINDAVVREQQLRLVIRDRPRWLPDRVWRWALAKLLVLEERDRRTDPPTEEEALHQAHEDFAKAYPATLGEAVEKLRAYPHDPPTEED